MLFKLLNYKMYIAIILLVVGMGSYTTILKMRVDALKLKVINQSSTITNLTSQVSIYKSDISKQNKYFHELLDEMKKSSQALKALRDDFNMIELSFAEIPEAKTPEEKKVIKKKIETYLDNSLVNSYNCLMKATGDKNVDCKE